MTKSKLGLLTPAMKEAQAYLDMVLEGCEKDFEPRFNKMKNLLRRYDILIHQVWPNFQAELRFIPKRGGKEGTRSSLILVKKRIGALERRVVESMKHERRPR